MSGPSELATLNLLTQDHTHAQADTHTYVRALNDNSSAIQEHHARGVTVVRANSCSGPKHIYLPQEVIGQTNVMNLLFLSC